jgi:hypothetical protein
VRTYVIGPFFEVSGTASFDIGSGEMKVSALEETGRSDEAKGGRSGLNSAEREEIVNISW